MTNTNYTPRAVRLRRYNDRRFIASLVFGFLATALLFYSVGYERGVYQGYLTIKDNAVHTRGASASRLDPDVERK